MINIQICYKIKNTFGMLYLKENAYYKNIMIWMIVPQKVFLITLSSYIIVMKFSKFD